MKALGALAGDVLLVDEDWRTLRMAAHQGYVAGSPTIWQDSPLDAQVPAADVLRTREALYFENAGELKVVYPQLEAQTGAIAAVASAVLPMFLDGRPLGSLVLDFKEPHTFTREERRFLQILAGQCAVALGRAESIRQLERHLEAQTRTNLEDAQAHEAFVAFTEAVGSETDLSTLVQQAITVLQSRFPDATVIYYEEEDGLWKGRLWSEDLGPDLVSVVAAGLPSEAPLFADLVRTRAPVFTDDWPAKHQQATRSNEYGAAGAYPLLVNGELHWLLSVGLRNTCTWNESGRALVRAVGRALNLALERTDTARQLTGQNVELQARTRALEAFADLTRDLALTTDPLLLIRRAQEVVMTMLSDGAALYLVPEGDRWYSRVQHGTLHSPDLQAAVDAGLPYAQTKNLLIPWTGGKPYYLNLYDQSSSSVPSLVGHIHATATLPLRVQGTLTGVLAFVLFDQRTWSGVDRVVLETAVQSLEMALDRAKHAQELAARTQQLESTTRELEEFSYSVAHDLRTPVRHMLGFLKLARTELVGSLNERSARYLDVVGQAGEQMNILIDAMLHLSNTAQQSLRPQTVDLNGIMTRLRERVLPDLMTRDIRWEVLPLPQVWGDWDALTQVLTQLTENALKFTQTRDPAIVRVWAEDRGDAWVVYVEDNGLGFDPQYQDRLFNMFQRLHTTQEASGTGVGLASVRRLILKHGGQVFAEGRVGQGATFGFTLPKNSSPRL